MSQTIIALCTAEQLASAIPDWQRYGIQFANTSERLNRFQAAWIFRKFNRMRTYGRVNWFNLKKNPNTHNI